MEHLPSAKSSSKNRNLESPCFSLLRKIYNRMPALKDHKEDISARFNDLREPYEHLVSQTEIDIVPDDALKNLLRSIYNVKKTHSLLGTLFVTGQSIDLNSKLSGSAGRVTANRHASNTNVERISPELLNSLRASSESALPHFMDRRTDSRFRYLSPSHHDQGSADYDEAAFENQLRSSLAEGDDIAEDLLVVIETTTGITRDLEIYLRRFVLEKDVERRSVVDAVKRYRDDLKLALDKSSQVSVYYYFNFEP